MSIKILLSVVIFGFLIAFQSFNTQREKKKMMQKRKIKDNH